GRGGGGGRLTIQKKKTESGGVKLSYKKKIKNTQPPTPHKTEITKKKNKKINQNLPNLFYYSQYLYIKKKKNKIKKYINFSIKLKKNKQKKTKQYCNL
ncbi:hypothetical protein ACSTHX_00855, partial [Vibrio parahaemolyticus]